MRSSDRASRLIVGTAQLGLDYGLANVDGRPSREAALAMLEQAAAAGVAAFDTAPTYGDAELLIGEARVKTPVHTKLTDMVDLVGAVRSSLVRLGRERIDVLLLHRPDALVDADELWTRLQPLHGFEVERFGVSVYSPNEFELAIEAEWIEVIQAPISAVDRRLVHGGLVTDAWRRGKEVIARSVFLQGALLLDGDSLPEHLGGLRSAIRDLDAVAEAVGASRRSLLVHLVLGTDGVASIVLGSETALQLAENIATLGENVELDGWSPPEEIEERLFDPRTWPTVRSRR